MISSAVVSPVLENKKLATSSIAKENFARSIATEQKSGMSLVNCRAGASSSQGNGVSVATKGKLATTQTTIKSVVTTDSHRFRKFVATDLKPAAHF